jgi:hypothetical protein
VIPHTDRQQAVFLAILSGISLIGCSKPASREPSTETAASSAGAPALADSAAPSPDSTSRPSAVAGSAMAASEKQASDSPVKAPKPSIDPGRKRGKPVTIPREAATPKKDSSAAAAATSSGQASPLKFDAASNTVTFDLSAGPFNFNGFSSGGATLTLPSKAKVVMNFVNKDGTPHSAEVINGDGPIPNAAVDPAIPRAYTNKVLEGLPQEATDVMRFTAPESGNYRIFCGVPGHGLSGMWVWMKVDPAAKAPSWGPTKS